MKLRKEDGTEVEVQYKPTSNVEQGQAVARWLIDNHGWRPSEAAMKVASMSKGKLRNMYKNLVLLEEVKQ